MNQKTAKLIRKACNLNGDNYRESKKRYNLIPGNQRGQWKEMVRTRILEVK